MKRDMDHPNLRAAFPPIPDDCRTALMRTARSVEEEQIVKHMPMRTVLIAAVLVLMMSAVAVAATYPGLREWLTDNMGIKLPRAAQEVLASTQKRSVTVGPVAFTVQEILADGRLAYMTATAYASDAILVSGDGDVTFPVGGALAAKLNHPAVTADTSYAEAADATGLPLYMANARLSPADYSVISSEMMDSMRLSDGSLMLIDMLYMNNMRPGAWKVDLDLYVDRIDPETYDTIDSWEARTPQELPIAGVMARRTYLPQASADAVSSSKLFGSLTVKRVEAELTCAGAYLTVCATPDDPLARNALYSIVHLDVLDEHGEPFSWSGINMMREIMNEHGVDLGLVDEQTPVTEVQCRILVSVDALPESFILTDGETTLVIR